MIQVYVGDGKGKTSAAFGAALRAAGAGWRVAAVQFLKDGSSAEIPLVAGLPGVVAVLHDGARAKFTFQMTDAEKVASRALHDANLRRALDVLGGVDASPEPAAGRLLVLDEALDALHAGLLDEELLREALAWGADAGAAGNPRELAVTGHSLPDFVRDAADYLTEFRCARHPYRQGVSARSGIEY